MPGWPSNWGLFLYHFSGGFWGLRWDRFYFPLLMATHIFLVQQASGIPALHVSLRTTAFFFPVHGRESERGQILAFGEGEGEKEGNGRYETTTEEERDGRRFLLSFFPSPIWKYRFYRLHYSVDRSICKRRQRPESSILTREVVCRTFE